jgi:hypothetical protein
MHAVVAAFLVFILIIIKSIWQEGRYEAADLIMIPQLLKSAYPPVGQCIEAGDKQKPIYLFYSNGERKASRERPDGLTCLRKPSPPPEVRIAQSDQDPSISKTTEDSKYTDHPSPLANESAFMQFDFGNDASIRIPRDWPLLDSNAKRQLNTYSEAVVRLAGINANQGNNQILVAANNYKEKPSATIRLSVRAGNFQNQSDIERSNLSEVRNEMEKTLTQLQQNLPDGVKSIRLLDVRIEKLGGNYSIVSDSEIQYSSEKSIERLDIIYMGDKVYKLSTSYRNSDAHIIAPIIRYIRQSLIIKAN